jgi:hypothetical protein
MNSAEKMAEVRERFSLPEPGAEQSGPSQQSQRLSESAPCYEGQWARR